MDSISNISTRKHEHIEICSNRNVESSDLYTGFSEVSFIPTTLPEIDISDIDTSTTFLGRRFHLPIMIAGMTGGVEQGEMINQRLAQAAEKFNIPMGVGSQRIAIENPKLKRLFDVKRNSSQLFVIGNIGCGQLRNKDALDQCKSAIEMIGADALALHVNVLQECVQPEGDRKFKGILQSIEHILHNVSTPVLIKEVGTGMSPTFIQKLFSIGVKYIDIGGKGGTSWPYIEGLRTHSPHILDTALTFRNFGIPTAYSLRLIRRQFADLGIIATGGIRDGLTIAKAMALGANMVGIGLPLFKAAMTAEEAPSLLLQRFKNELEITMLATSSSTVSELHRQISPAEHPLKREFLASFNHGEL